MCPLTVALSIPHLSLTSSPSALSAGELIDPWAQPWARVNSMRYKGDIARVMLMVFAAMFVVLGYLGVKAPSEGRTLLAQIATVFYFAYFITMPSWTSTHVKRTSIISCTNCVYLGGIVLFQ